MLTVGPVLKVSGDAVPTLYLRLSCSDFRADLVCYSIEVDLQRPAILTVPSRWDREGKPVWTQATVWEKGYFGVCPTTSLRQVVTDALDNRLTELADLVSEVNPREDGV